MSRTHGGRATAVVMVAVAAALTLGLGACSTSEPDPPASASVPASGGVSASGGGSASGGSASASPSSTLSPAEQQAFDEATATVVAYRQTIADLYTGARTDLNDLNDVATGDLLDQGLRNISQGLAAGRTAEPRGVEMVLVSSEPVSIDLKGDPEKVVVRACIDATALTTIQPDGTRDVGVREVLDYTVKMTTYLPAPGWGVARVQGKADPKDRTG